MNKLSVLTLLILFFASSSHAYINNGTGGSSSGSLTSLNGQTGSIQVFSNDTNITVTSSNGTHALGWAGTLSLARGGTSASLTAANGGIVYSDASKFVILPAGTSGQLLSSGGAGAPSWSSTSGFLTTTLSNLSASNSASNALNMATHYITNVIDPVNAQDAATMAYVDNRVNGLTWKNAVRLATAVALPANTYSNGSSGVGATLTAVGVGALSVDSTAVVIGDRVLVKNEVATANNGIYTVTVAGSGIAAYVLTRSTDFDQSADIAEGDTVFVEEGSALTGTSWSLTTSGAITVGTTGLAFSQVAGPGYLVSGSGISITGTTISLITPVTISSGGTNNASLGTVLGGVVYTDASKLNTLAAGTAGQFLKSGGAGTPVWAPALSSLNSQTAATQIFSNDTNVTMTSSNNTHALGWSSTLSLARGGTGAALTAANGDIMYTDASKAALLPAGTSGQILTSGGAGIPTWGTPGANTALSNLASVAINSPLLPATDLALDFGSTSKKWSTMWANNVENDSGSLNLVSGSSTVTLQGIGASGVVFNSTASPSSDGGTNLGTTSVRFGVVHSKQNSIYGDTSGSVALKAADATTTYTLKFPPTAGVGGDVIYYSGSGLMANLAAGTSGQILTSGGANAPSWAAATGISSLGAQTGATQVFANDANITITSSNNTHTLGWASTLSIARGGTANGAITFSSLTDGATVTWPLQGLTNNAKVALFGNRTLDLTGLVAGMSGTLEVIQDTSGNRTLGVPSSDCTNKIINGGAGAFALSTAANAVDMLAFTYDGTDCFWTIGNNYN